MNFAFKLSIVSEAQKVAKNTIFLSIANTLPRISQAIVIFVAARMIGDAGLGKYYTVASLVAMTSLFTDLGITPSFTREVSTHKDQASKYFVNLFLIKIILGILSYLSLIILTYALNYSLDIIQAAYVYGGYLAIWTLISLYLSLYQAFEEMKYNAWIWGSSAILNLVISLYLLFNNGGFMSPVWGLSLAAVASLIIAVVFARNKIRFNFSLLDWQFLRQNLKLAIPFALNTIFSTVYFRINSIILSKIKPEEIMGWYGAAYKLLDNLVVLPNFFLGALYPVLCRFYKESYPKFVEVFSQAIRVLALGAFPISVGLFLISKKVILFLYGPEFVNGSLSLQILSFALMAIFFTSLGVQTLMAMGRMKVVNYVGAINILLNVGLSFWLIPEKGANLSLNGAAIASLICELFGLMVFTIYFWLKKLINWSIVKSISKPIISTLIMGVLVYLSLPYNMFINITIGVAVYLLMMGIIGGFSEKELSIIKSLVRKDRLAK